MGYSYNGILYSNEKERTTVTRNVNESHRHNVERNKPNAEGSIPCDSIFIKF